VIRAFPPGSTYARGLIGIVKEEKHLIGNPGAPTDSASKKRWERQWNDMFHRVVRCAFCPDWSCEGDGPTTREALAEHRMENHL